ncbi:MAG: methyltransferase domain-containing protein [Bryobacterales bacterium]|nr:methyltransferase domain-containing protein [Bryobacterales bacterium]
MSLERVMKSITSFRFRAFYSGAIICGLLIACGSIPLRSNDAQDDARRILEKLRVASGATVGEIGGGDGDVAVAVATLLGNEGRVLVTELDPAKIESMQKRFARGNSATVKVTASSADSTKLPDQCCDGIYMRDVYHHFTNPKAMVASLYRNLKPGGRLVVIDFRPRTGGNWSTPAGVPSNRGGHGIPIALLREELEAGGFRHLETIEQWRDNLYAVVMEKPR